MKDNENVVEHDRDRGEEPSLSWDVCSSDDIWVREQNDGFTNHDHQNAEYYTTTGASNFVYVQVRNRGYINSSNSQLKLY